MDISTLLFCILFVSLLMMGVAGFLYYVNRTERYLVDWCISGACFALSNLLGIAGSHISLPYILVPSIGNAFYLAAHTAIFTGIIRLTTDKNYRLLIVIFGVLTFASHFSSYVSASVENRIIFFYCLIIPINFASIIYLLKNKEHQENAIYWPLTMTLVLFLLQQVVRALVLVTNTFNLSLFDSHFMQTSGSFFLLLYLTLLTISYLLIVHWRKESLLHKVASTDPLTGWYNRNDIERLMNNKYKEARKRKSTIGFLMIDIDHFKLINDQYGHLIGDKAIKHICDTTKGCIRNDDDCFRFGGEEFVICIADSNLITLKLLAEKIRSKIENSPLVLENESLELTVSIGISTSSVSDGSWNSAVDRADKALYKAKHMGRNQTVDMLAI